MHRTQTLIVTLAAVLMLLNPAVTDATAADSLFVDAPEFTLSESAPLTGLLTFSTIAGCKTSIEITSSDRRKHPPIVSAADTAGSVSVYGLRPDTEYSVQVRATTGNGETETATASFSTDPLPHDFPTIRLITSQPDRMEPGVTIFSLFRWDDDLASKDFGLFVAVDEEGEVLWYYRCDSPAAALHVLPGGNFMFIHGTKPKNIREVDRLGNTVREFQAVALGDEPREGVTPVDVDTLHHDFFPLPDGGLLALTSEVRRLERFPLNMSRPRRDYGPANVIGDVVVQIAPNGNVTRRWPLLDLLDPLRITYDSHDSFWDLRGYEHIAGGTKDWSHTNTIIRDTQDGGLILSLRHQDAIVKIDAATSEVKWILGTPAGWRGPLARKVLKPTSRMDWPFHAHGVKRTPHGTLLMFDNGNLRAIPPARPRSAKVAYSRAVENAVDEEAMTVEQVWSFGGPPGDPEYFYSPFLCDADWLPKTGNVLITDGARVADEQGQPVNDPPGATQWARLLEVTRDDPSEVVWELHIDDRHTRPNVGWSIYRAERLPRITSNTKSHRSDLN